VSKKVRLYLIIGATAAVLLTAGIVVTVNVFTRRIDSAIPQASLFTPTVAASTGAPAPRSSPTPEPGADIVGPLNILIVGVDTREDEPDWQPKADAVMIMHINKDLQSAYLTSLPRDQLVDIPAYGPSHFGGENSKLTHAMAFGSVVPGSQIPNPVQGFPLLAQTVSRYSGIDHFDAGALVTFTGIRTLVNAIGGIDMYIDEQTASIHVQPDASGRIPCPSCPNGVTGPAMTYNVGTTMHLVGWQAEDYARQRYIPGGDYARQRHQRQMIKAMMTKIVSGGFLLSNSRFTDVLDALGKTLIFDGRGRKPTEFLYALRNLRADKVTPVGLPGNGVYSGGTYLGENLTPIEGPFFAAMKADTLPAFLSANPGLLNSATAG
jgi:anionic cell wall polymer biosynthesis LytR-Cps2A-Psr (LCP) family protein